MAERGGPTVGLSVGATNLAAVSGERSVIRASALHHRQSTPAADPASWDSRTDDALTLLAEPLAGLAEVVADQGGPMRAAVTHPAHWPTGAVEALTGALRRASGWSAIRPPVLSDAAAALGALQVESGLPERGIIALCDFGGTGTSLTLVDAANGYRPVGATTRDTDFSGDGVDRVLLNRVLANLSADGFLDTSETSAADSLTHLYDVCRQAKEELSSRSDTVLTVELPGFHGDVHFTRAELDAELRVPLEDFVSAIRNTLQRSEIRISDLTAIASVGGGAQIPVIPRTLIDHLRVPVITTARPQLASATGAALWAERPGADDDRTALAPANTEAASVFDAATSFVPAPAAGETYALAWSQADDDEDSDVIPFLGDEDIGGDGDTSDEGGSPWSSWRMEVILVGVLLAVVILLAVIMVALKRTPETPTPPPVSPPETTTAPTSPEETTTTTRPAGPTEAPSPKAPEPAPAPPPRRTYQPPPQTQAPPPPPQTQAPPAPPPQTQAPPPPQTQAPPPPQTQAPPSPQPPAEAPPEPPATQAPAPPPRRQQPTNPFKPRDPSLPNPFNPFAPGLWRSPPDQQPPSHEFADQA